MLQQQLEQLPKGVQELLLGERDICVRKDRSYKHIVAGGRKNFLVGNRGRCVVYVSAQDNGMTEVFSNLSTAQYHLLRKPSQPDAPPAPISTTGSLDGLVAS